MNRERISRRELLQRAGAMAATTAWTGLSGDPGFAEAVFEGAAAAPPGFEWIRSVRLMIAEGYAPPFFPSLDYDPKKAVELARKLNCNAFRYPTFSYVAFFPTKTKLPHHPELGGRDLLRETLDLCHAAGLKFVAYNPLNHPFMDTQEDNPEYGEWIRRDAEGRPMMTRHMGWARYYEGCLNSPLRDQIRERVREVVANYPVDLMYFDGPYQGMEQRLRYCHCQYCTAAYKKAKGKNIPAQGFRGFGGGFGGGYGGGGFGAGMVGGGPGAPAGAAAAGAPGAPGGTAAAAPQGAARSGGTAAGRGAAGAAPPSGAGPYGGGSSTLEERIEYEQWLEEDVVLAFMHEICDMVRQIRNVPIVYNDTGLLGADWRARAFRYTDGFMFEAADTPEEKLFNLRLGQSTGKVIWTYVSSHTEYNGEHLRDKSVHGWYSAPVEGDRLALDAAVATAAGAGYCYWGLNRLFYLPQDPLEDRSLRGLKAIFDFAEQNDRLLQSVSPKPQAGVLIGTQALQWYQGGTFFAPIYRNYCYGAGQILKDIGYDAQAFLDYEMTPQKLAAYQLVYVPNAPCLSDAQGALLAGYVEGGGHLVATHLTSTADEFGRPRHNYGMSQLLGAGLKSFDPLEIPELYLRVKSSGQLIPQDSQVMWFEAEPGAEVLAETLDRGHRTTVGPAVLMRRQGKGQVIYIGSGLEAVYEETLNSSLRAYFHSLLDPLLASSRTYDVEFRPGLMAQFASSEQTLLLHLVANTGNIWKKLLVQEEFLPIQNVRVRLRLPQGRSAKSVALMWSKAKPAWSVRQGWVELTVPQVQVYEVVRVDLRS
jgi:hypothetical protein